MSLQRIGPSAGNRPNLLRNLAAQAAAHPRMEAAILGAVRAELPGVIEELLRKAHGGETLRIYVAAGPSQASKGERDRRIRAQAAPPSSLPLAAIAAREGISLRRVQQILARNLAP